MTTAAQNACGGSCLWHWLKLQLPAQAAIAGGAKHIDRQYVPRFTQARQNLSRAIHAAAVVAGSSSTGIVRASGANPYNKGRLRPLGWMRLQVTVWPTGARSSCGASSSSVLRPKVQRLAPACEHRRKSSALAHRVRACTSGSSTHSGCNHALRLQATAKRHTRHNGSLRCYLKPGACPKGA